MNAIDPTEQLRALIREEITRLVHDTAAGSAQDGGAADLGAPGSLDAGDSGSLGGALSGDTLTPTYQTVDGTGRVGASFTGLVKALGLIVPSSDAANYQAAVAAPVSSQDTISWQPGAGGAVIAEAWGYTYPQVGATPPGTGAMIQGQANGATAESDVQLRALDDQGTQRALLLASQVARGTSAYCQAFAQKAGGSNQGVTLIDGNGASSFLQLINAPANVKLAFGSTSFLAPSGWSTAPQIQCGAAPNFLRPFYAIEVPGGAGAALLSDELRLVTPDAVAASFFVDVNLTTPETVVIHWAALCG